MPRPPCALMLAASVAVIVAAPALAQTPAQFAALRTACAADAAKICTAVQADDAALFECLKARRDELIPPCGATVAALIVSLRKPRAP